MKRWLLLLAICGLFACENENDFDPCKSDFDQQALLENVSKNIIQQDFKELNDNVQEMKVRKDEFLEDPTRFRFSTIESTFLGTYINYQKVDLYASFGPGEEVQLRSALNNFPVDESQIEANIANGTWNLDAPDSFDKGFPALDYLLYGIWEAGVETPFQYYQNNPTAVEYLSDVIDHIAEKVSIANEAWQGEYAEQFISNTGTAAGSSISQLVNALNQHYENIKRDKIGIPSGVATLGFTNPTRVEAYYSQTSIQLMRHALIANSQLFRGSTSVRDGIGFDDYLREVNTHRKDDPVDVEAILNQYTSAMNAVDSIVLITKEAALSTAIEVDNEPVINAYNELVKQIVRLKNDMPEALCVPITYIDNPSDSD